MKHSILIAIAVSSLAACASAPREPVIPAHGVIGVTEAQLDPEFWIHRGAGPRLVLDEAAIEAQNEKMKQLDKSIHDIDALPSTLSAAEVHAWVDRLSERPDDTLYDEKGQVVEAAAIDAIVSNANVAAIPATQPTRFGMVVRRSDLRTFPTRTRVFSNTYSTDIDQFQEDGLYPGTPVAIVHESRDGEWWFIVSPRYAAWISRNDVAEGSRDEVLAYTHKEPYVVITGPTAHTVFTPERPEVSDLRLEMGQRVPVLSDWPAEKPVNGQHPYTAHVIELPMRAADGSLHFTPALLPRTSDVATNYLPLTRANLIHQGFKFLGERYGWGNSYNARDCSGFVSEVYRSFGVQLPRNTRDQAVSPALNRIAFTADDDHEKRLAVLRELQVGDLVYIPGHVMMVIGQDGGGPYVIHDTTGITYRDAEGTVTRVLLNGVSVTPLLPLLDGKEHVSRVDRIYSIQRIRK
ncbi:MAG TPA: SH3 domain-containing protein [Steroidobacteraceae bacterium]|nr:SH3 domain-containing protein [Steroidobacteraceae bacterium]